MTIGMRRKLYDYCLTVARCGLYNETQPPTFDEWNEHLTNINDNRVLNNWDVKSFVKQELYLFEQDVLGDGEPNRIYELADYINTWFIEHKEIYGVNLVSKTVKRNHISVPHLELAENLCGVKYVVIIAIIDAYYDFKCPELHEQLHD